MNRGEHYYYGASRTGVVLVGRVQPTSLEPPPVDWTAWAVVVLGYVATFMSLRLVWSWLP